MGILDALTVKPLAEQTIKELSNKIERNKDRIEAIYNAINEAQTYMEKERKVFSEIESSPDEPFKKHRREHTFINLTSGFIIALAAFCYTLLMVNPENLPYWANVIIQNNKEVILIIVYSVCISIGIATASFIGYMMINYFFKYLRKLCGIKEEIEQKLSPVDTFVRAKKRELDALESRYTDYLERVNGLISDLKVENIEIEQLTVKKEILRNSL